MSDSLSVWTLRPGEDLGLEPNSMPKWKGAAGVEDLLDDLAELVDLYGEDSAGGAAALVLGDGAGEGVVEGADAVVAAGPGSG